MVANVIPNLFDAPEGGKITDRVHKNHHTAQSHTGGDPGHVLLGHASIYEPRGESLRKGFHNPEAEVSDDQADPLVLLRQFQQGPDESGSHCPTLSSAKAF
jgi:hypothetical protein